MQIIQNIITDVPEREYIESTSIEHRKKFAQFFTPFPIAKFMAKWIMGNHCVKTILDPAFGLGVFARAIREINIECSIKGFDVDKIILNEAINLFAHETNTTLYLKDYMFNDWENKYDGIICNPPYFKFHDYENKAILKEIEHKINLKLNGFTNLYSLFLLKSVYQLNENGRAAYIIPSEFLNSDYGKLVKSYLVENQSLRYIIVVDFEENIFDNALTTASILLFANDDKSKKGVEFIYIKTLSQLFELQEKIDRYPNTDPTLAIPFTNLKPEIKWRAYYQQQNAGKYKNLVPFTNYGKVVRGIATGANDFFIFNLSKAKENSIEFEHLLPCICKAIDAKKPFFTKADFDELKDNNKSVFLLNAVNYKSISIEKYLQYGIKKEIHRKFLTASRSPWYRLEKRPAAPIWVSVFNRNGLRFIRNEAEISNLTTFHCIYLNMFSVSKADLLFAYLLTDISKQIFGDNRREYGNGLQKFEPNDINKSFMLDLQCIDMKTEDKIIELYNRYRQSVINNYPEEFLVNEINKIFLKHYQIDSHD